LAETAAAAKTKAKNFILAGVGSVERTTVRYLDWCAREAVDVLDLMLVTVIVVVEGPGFYI